MAVNKLPIEVQSMLCASANVSSYKTAVEELVYNSIDAKCSSIAIRVNIQEGSIQVIDNGHGLTKPNLNLIGQKHMTNKTTDKITLKSAPDFYGYKGEFLANLISVAQLVKITSRYENQDETWSKSFVNGKEKKIAKMSTRPSKGTTVEVKGFFYNLHIVRQDIDVTNEIQNIKTFLEELSLVHHALSVSLRDDLRNDILLKIPKKRDIYHTLSTLYNIDEHCVQELSVEKNQYKVKAFIGKDTNEYDKQWIYINKRIVRNSRLYKNMNKYLKKYLQIKQQKPLKKRDKNNAACVDRTLPFYFLFITCPYIDYDINTTPKQSVLEFKSWEQINKLLEKLVKFYVGDVNLKPKNKAQSQVVVKNSAKITEETRDKVQKIMKRILGSSSKKPEVSELQKGVKGKNIKRHNKKDKKEIRTAEVRKLLFENKQTEIPSPKTQTKETNNIKNIEPTNEENKIAIESDTKINEPVAKCSSKCNNIPKNSKLHKNKKITKHKRDHHLKVPNGAGSILKNTKITPKQVRDYLKDDWTHQAREYFNWRHKTNFQQNKASVHNGRFYHGIIHKQCYKRKPDYKTTYDLIKSVIDSQQPDINIEQNEQSLVKSVKRDKKRHLKTALNISKFESDLLSQMFSIEYDNRHFYPRQRKASQSNNNTPKPETFSMIQDIEPNNVTHDIHNLNLLSANLPQSMYAKVDTKYSLNNRDLYEKEFLKYATSNLVSSRLTFESHCYNTNNFRLDSNVKSYKEDDHRFRFITKQSRENFNASDEKFKPQHTRQIKRKNYTIYNHLQNKYYNVEMQQTTDTLSYSIHCSKSVETRNNFENEKFAIGNSCIDNNDRSGTLNFNLQNTYTIHSDQIHNDNTEFVSNLHNIPGSQYSITNNEGNNKFGTYNIAFPDTGAEYNLAGRSVQNEEFISDTNLKIVFLSKSQSPGIEPMNMCKAVLSDSDIVGSTLGNNNNNCINDSLYNNLDNNSDNVRNILNMESNDPIDISKDIMENVSHHFFNNTETANQFNQDDTECLNEPMNFGSNRELNLVPAIESKDDFDFNLKDRPRFLPKGMSQIYVNCQTKGSCNYTLNEDYYENSIYDNFVNDVQTYSEIYEPLIQNVDDCTTKNINKFQNKLKTDNASLIFDKNSLENAQVLNQVDCKFIAAAITEKYSESRDSFKYLVLFDQHAVSERVMLETNISDYLKENQWQSKLVENIILKLNKDEIIYLHNYKDKFNQLGLQWTILNVNEIDINAIPLAIFGKHPREVDKIMKAVQLLIQEEINYIRQQKGCVNLYPKSTMDLVNSEACRYAIMFGDKLSKDECKDMLSSLSNCKVPFQCAHGRPVMAVLVNIEKDKHEYKINMERLLKFKEQTKKLGIK